VIARFAAAAAFVLVPASAGASATRPVVALTASPVRATLVGSARQLIRVANAGAEPVVVDVVPAGFALGPRGRPRVLLVGDAARRAAAWLAIRPSRIALGPGASTNLTLVSKPPRAATPGDHPALVLLTTRASPLAPVAVRMRIGITVVVRVPGRTRHGLALRSLRVRHVAHRRLIELVIANRGNVVEWLRRGRFEVVLLAHGRVIARLQSAARELLPRASGIVQLAYGGDVRGRVTALVVFVPSGRRATTLRRTFRVWL